MKRLSLFVLIIAAFLLPALFPAPAAEAIYTSNAVQIPLELKLALNGVILFGVMFGLQWVFDKVGIDLRGLGTVLAGVISEFAILQFQGLIDLVPAQYDLFVMIGLNVLLAVLTSLGFFRAVFQRERAAALLK